MARTTGVITDFQMRGLSGLDLQQELQSPGYHTPVILVTAYPNNQHRTRALNNGAVGFLSKPFDDRSLMECLTDGIKLHHKSGFLAPKLFFRTVEVESASQKTDALWRSSTDWKHGPMKDFFRKFRAFSPD